MVLWVRIIWEFLKIGFLSLIFHIFRTFPVCCFKPQIIHNSYTIYLKQFITYLLSKETTDEETLTQTNYMQDSWVRFLMAHWQHNSKCKINLAVGKDRETYVVIHWMQENACMLFSICFSIVAMSAVCELEIKLRFKIFFSVIKKYSFIGTFF